MWCGVAVILTLEGGDRVTVLREIADAADACVETAAPAHWAATIPVVRTVRVAHSHASPV